ncbi:hypothetical protein H0H81_009303 [Sphagnurus paluster]|uniref:Uncharacterized protein n=1 Tax=Sphagnurus paluster TaxID=117069 RepID=A0A9P7GK67_9AGAR|nr:hypothetical protein H0H81_009303 [Sphagnurus paluster]
MPGRRSTVYDLASLRLHPDGTRVQQSTSANLRMRHVASAQDARGNWFARDAAGSAKVAKYRRVRDDKDGEGEAGDSGKDTELQTTAKGNRKEKEKEKTSKRTGKKLKARPAKRQKFLHDFDFLAPETNVPSSSSSEQPLPSSDLLKSIHYFASSYYHERGQLMNLTKDYRVMRKQNTLRRRAEKERAEVEGDEEALKPVRRGGVIKGSGKKIYPKDMYKILDGSALVAIGMLMQEYVVQMLEVRIPDGWEDMVQEAYANGDNTEDDDDDGLGKQGEAGDEVGDERDEEGDEEQELEAVGAELRQEVNPVPGHDRDTSSSEEEIEDCNKGMQSEPDEEDDSDTE